ncbi:hypothetical protein H9L10_06235 [Phycicoccus endophyticus]|uniref:Uncharacterized protein n=1 Tax=Phycicoccus endophyticus TaxID=1690220 RepID=A0A7G9R4P0_9MICO|nr:hypothetical protein [Phycicoccus endophyticus]NHI18471.1 hypothetical protein [Phycicoccus endophyticus]QNN50565.1 hypothetical protein H9L10_06235 [Phycicoccus endophyticus]GGL23514.1 hypothetical protein GCM10012283_02030 [Phycicoccus endophyticus]
MKLYSDVTTRRAAQVAADVGVVVWVVLWVRLGLWLHEVTLRLAEPGHRLADAGAGFRDTMTRAGDSLEGLPLLQDRVAAPFRSAADIGGDLQQAGADLADGVGRVAVLLGLTTAAAPVLLVVGTWLLLRWRFVRRASAAARFVDADPDLDLFALRAMANQPMERLARISPDPAGAWRRGERDVVRALAVLELRECGLRPPPQAAVSPPA